MQTSLELKTCSQFLISFLKSILKLEYFERKNQCHSLSITEIHKCETGSYLNVQKAIFHATPRHIICSRIPNTAEIIPEPASYHPPINLS